MMPLVLISLLVGMVIAQRFKVLILFPAILLALVITIASGIALAKSSWMVATAAFVATVAVQIGYLLGAGIHHLMVVTRASRIRSGSMPSTLPPRRTAH